MNPFERPVTAGPNDRVVGRTEWGTPIYQTLTGQRYYDQPNWAPEPVAPFEALTTTVDDQGRGIHNRAPREEPNTLRIVNALVGEAMRGINAPKNALRGEPVSLGDTWATALDWGLLGGAAPVPEGALRSTAWNTEKMYHGTPDVRGLRDAGGFQQRRQTVSRLSDPNAWEEVQARLGDITPGTSAYNRALDEAGDLIEQTNINSPVFFSPNYRMAESYADDTRAFDYQNAIPEVVTASTNPQRVLDVDAGGQSFRGISKDGVKRGLLSQGVPEDEIDMALRRYTHGRAEGKMSTDDLAALAQEFDFDAVDVSRVKDNYFGGGTAGRVRMMLNMDQIDTPTLRNYLDNTQ